MFFHYILASFLFFGFRRNNAVVKETGRKSALSVRGRYSTEIVHQGTHCNLFESRAQELCAQTTKDEKIELSILMANCHLETLGSPPLSISTAKGMAHAPDTEKIIAMQMLSKLPVFCSTMATMGMKLGFMSQSHTFGILNDTNIKLDEITRIATDAQTETRKSIELSEQLLKVSSESLNYSERLAQSSEAIQKGMANFTSDLSTMFEVFSGFERKAAEAAKMDQEAARVIKNFTEETRQIIENIESSSGSGYLESQLVVENMQYQIILIVLLVMFILSKTSAGFFITLFFFVAVIGLASLSTLHSTEGVSLALRLLNYSNFAIKFLTGYKIDVKASIIMYYTKLKEFVKPRLIIDRKYLFMIAASAIIIWLGMLILKLRRRRQRMRDWREQQSHNDLLTGFDVHNSRDVLDLLKHQENSLIQMQSQIEKTLNLIRFAQRVGSRSQPARYGQPIVPDPAFMLRKWKRSPISFWNGNSVVATSTATPRLSTDVPITGRKVIAEPSNVQQAKVEPKKSRKVKAEPTRTLEVKEEPDPVPVPIASDAIQIDRRPVAVAIIDTTKSKKSKKRQGKKKTKVKKSDVPLLDSSDPAEREGMLEDWANIMSKKKRSKAKGRRPKTQNIDQKARDVDSPPLEITPYYVIDEESVSESSKASIQFGTAVTDSSSTTLESNLYVEAKYTPYESSSSTSLPRSGISESESKPSDKSQTTTVLTDFESDYLQGRVPSLSSESTGDESRDESQERDESMEVEIQEENDEQESEEQTESVEEESQNRESSSEEVDEIEHEEESENHEEHTGENENGSEEESRSTMTTSVTTFESEAESNEGEHGKDEESDEHREESSESKDSNSTEKFIPAGDDSTKSTITTNVTEETGSDSSKKQPEESSEKENSEPSNESEEGSYFTKYDGSHTDISSTHSTWTQDEYWYNTWGYTKVRDIPKKRLPPMKRNFKGGQVVSSAQPDKETGNVEIANEVVDNTTATVQEEEKNSKVVDKDVVADSSTFSDVKMVPIENVEEEEISDQELLRRLQKRKKDKPQAINTGVERKKGSRVESATESMRSEKSKNTKHEKVTRRKKRSVKAQVEERDDLSVTTETAPHEERGRRKKATGEWTESRAETKSGGRKIDDATTVTVETRKRTRGRKKDYADVRTGGGSSRSQASYMLKRLSK